MASFIRKVKTTFMDSLDHEGVALKDAKTTLSLCFLFADRTGRECVCSYSIGDSVIALIADNNVRRLSNMHGGDYAGATMFFDDADVSPKDISTELLNDPLSGVYLMTDGVADGWFDSESDVSQIASWDVLLSDLEQAIYRSDNRHDSLMKLLDTYHTGNHDDRTIAGYMAQVS
jgi:hypothetical protein